MNPLATELPATEAETRRALYAGTIFHLPADDATARLVREVWAEISGVAAAA